MIKFVFLSENKTDNPPCMAEHGLSVYIETEKMKILFDTGASDLFLKNARILKVDINAVDAAVISHGHYDHTEGLPAFCKENSRASIYMHKDSFGETYGMEDGDMDKNPCGILLNQQQISLIKDRIVYTDNITRLSDDVVISGRIPDYGDCQPTEMFFRKQQDGSFCRDSMSHEQFLIIRHRDEQGNSQGLYVFSGCSHKGVIPVIKYTKEIFPEERIVCLVAGMHLYKSGKDVRDRVVSQIALENMDMVMPVHCTGINAICDLKTRLGEKCIVATAGDSYERS